MGIQSSFVVKGGLARGTSKQTLPAHRMEERQENIKRCEIDYYIVNH